MKYPVSEPGAVLRNIIIMALEYPPKTGAGACVLELIEGLARAGYEVAVISPSAISSATLQKPNMTVRLVAASGATNSNEVYRQTISEFQSGSHQNGN